jgi:hypothetical protein
MATGPGFYDNLCPQSWQDGSAATWTLQDPHQQSMFTFHLPSMHQKDFMFCYIFSFVSIVLWNFPISHGFSWQPSTAQETKCVMYQSSTGGLLLSGCSSVTDHIP